MKPIPICLVEDDSKLLQALKSLIDHDQRFAVVGAYDCPRQALTEADWPCIRVLLTDLDMPELSGVELIQQACAENPDLLAMAYTVCENRQMVYSAIQAGAYGYILKSSPISEIGGAIQELVDGGSPMSPGIARMVLRDFRSDVASQALATELSEREVMVLRLIAQGLLYKEVADELNISTHTVHTFLKRIYSKLHVHNRRSAVQVARQTGLV
jgi:DNA-binding NarL/FixJ family response regulator